MALYNVQYYEIRHNKKNSTNTLLELRAHAHIKKKKLLALWFACPKHNNLDFIAFYVKNKKEININHIPSKQHKSNTTGYYS